MCGWSGPLQRGQEEAGLTISAAALCRNVREPGAAGKVKAEDPGQDGGSGPDQAGRAHAQLHLHLPRLRQAAAPRATFYRRQLRLLWQGGGHALPGEFLPPPFLFAEGGSCVCCSPGCCRRDASLRYCVQSSEEQYDVWQGPGSAGVVVVSSNPLLSLLKRNELVCLIVCLMRAESGVWHRLRFASGPCGTQRSR